jgi:hypothetical protein
MIETIRWMVQREPHGTQYHVGVRAMSFFLLGGLAGGAVAGVLLALGAYALYMVIGSHLIGFALASAIAALAFAGRQLEWWTIPKFSLRHQVPEAWRNIFAPSAASFLYAGALGLTFFTRISSFAVYPLVILMLGIGERPWAIICLFAVAGLVRAGTALLVLIRRWAYLPHPEVLDELLRISSIVNKGSAAVAIIAALSLLAWAFLTLV